MFTKSSAPFRLTGAFSLSEEEAQSYLEDVFWPNGPQCPCGSRNNSALRRSRTREFYCKDCGKLFSLRGCTPFKKSHVSFATWVAAIRLWYCFGAELYPQYLLETIGIPNRVTAKIVMNRVHEVMSDEKNQKRFSAQNGAPNRSPQARSTMEFRKENRKYDRKREKWLESKSALMQ